MNMKIPPGKPDWEFWHSTSEVKAWEAAVLSWNVEPRGTDVDKDEIIAKRPVVKNRIRLCLEYLSDPAFFTPGTLNTEDPNLSVVKLPEFSAWLIQIEGPEAIPKELAAMGEMLVFERRKLARQLAESCILDEVQEQFQCAGIWSEGMRRELTDDLFSHALRAYEPGGIAPYRYGPDCASQVNPLYEEIYWDDLNKWLADKHPRIKFRFTAPTPITPLNPLPSKLSPLDTNVKGQTDWKHWRHVSIVELWQALLLSLNIEPPGNGWLLSNSIGRPGDIPYAYLDSNGLTEKFIQRWSLLCNRLESLYGHLEKVELTQFIKLSIFASWAIEFEWDNLPLELVALAQSPKSKTEEPPPSISVPHKSPRDRRPWETLPEHFNAISGVYMYQQAAREIADAEGWDDSKLEEFQSAMADALKTGLLRRRSHKTGLVIASAPDSLMHVSTADDVLWLVTVDDVNAWLEKQGVAYRWHVTDATPTAETLTPQSAPELPTVAKEGKPIQNGRDVGEQKNNDAPTSNWKMKVQVEATKRFIRLRKSGASPTVNSIKDDLAKWCRDNDIKTDSGIYPTGAYMRVHVLSSKHWTPPNGTVEQAEQIEQVNLSDFEQERE